MRCSLRGLLWALALCGSLSTTLEAGVDLVNGSTNTAWVWSDIGPLHLGPGQAAMWVGSVGSNVWYGFDGQTSGVFTVQYGHDYRVLCSDGVAHLCDLSAEHTSAFWWGLSFGFAAGMASLGARWVKQIVGGSFNE